MSPAARAIGIAAFVIAVALGVYTVAATLDRWPELVVAAWGASLGAGVAINGIAFREMDFEGTVDVGHRGAAADRVGAAQHQLCSVLVAAGAWQTAETESPGWALATVLLALAWAWTLPRLVTSLEAATIRDALRGYFRAFLILALLVAVGLMYASVALETAWLWRPAVPADLQGSVWLVVLEFSGLPLTLVALHGPPTRGRPQSPP